MKIINQNSEILNIDENILERIEMAGRTCYQSFDKITKNSAEKFVQMLQKKNHGAMLEFADIMVRFITDRGVTHELVRHRHCSFAQESTRYVRYDKDPMEFILPTWSKINPGYYVRGDLISCSDDSYPTKYDEIWMDSCIVGEENYNRMMKEGCVAQQARQILPNSLKTEIVVKANLREWLHILELRTSKASHPQMVDLMTGLLNQFRELLPSVFGGEDEE